MKTKDMFAALEAFAGLADIHRAGELRKLAAVFSTGKDETVAARVKKIHSYWKSAPTQSSYPATLKQSLVSIVASLSVMGARTQAADFEALVSLCVGTSTNSAEAFVGRITAALSAPTATVTRRRSAAGTQNRQATLPDQELARKLAGQLTASLLTPGAFEKVVDGLRDRKAVPTATLHAVANLFLGSSQTFENRKPAIEAVIKRQKENLKLHARGKALNQIGV